MDNNLFEIWRSLLYLSTTDINLFKILELVFCLGIMSIFFIWMIGEMVHSIMKISNEKKVAGYKDKEKFSVVTVIYMVCIYGQFLFWGMRAYSQHLFRFTFFSWVGNMAYYHISFACIFCMGIFNLANAAFLHERRKLQEIRRIWIVLKIGMIPFYLLNTVHYIYESKVPEELYWTSIFSAVFFIVLFPFVALALPCVLNFLNGCIGWYYIYYLRKQNKKGKRPFWIHYVLQAFPILDLISMVVMLKGHKVSPDFEERTAAKSSPNGADTKVDK